MENLTLILSKDVIRITKIGMLDVGNIQHDVLSDTLSSNSLKLSDNKITVFDEINQEGYISLHNNDGIKVLVFSLQSETEEDIVITTRSTFMYKLWINDRLAGYIGNGTDPLMIGKIQKGVNTFIFEINGKHIDGCIALRISKYAYESHARYDRLIWGNLGLFSKKAVLLTGTEQACGTNMLKYLLIANDSVNLALDQKVKVNVFTKISMKPIYETECVFNRNGCIDLSNLTQSVGEDENVLYMRCVYANNHGETLVTDTHVCLAPTEEIGSNIINDMSKYINSANHTEYEKCAGEFMIKNYETTHNIDFLWEMCDFLRYKKSGVRYDTKIYESGGISKYYKSKLTHTTGKYGVSVPKNYNRDKAYPLLVVIDAIYEEITAKIYSKYPYEDIIAVVISSQGFTLGSYVGEAAIWDALDDITDTYNIDEDRIYVAGSSNGGAATWGFAKAYPDRFAGIYVVSGHLSYDNIENMKNLKIYNISSKSDGIYDVAYEKALENLIKCKHFTGILAENMNHGDLMFLRYNEYLLKELLEHRRDKYPKEIYYQTDNYRNLKAYWIATHSIEYGEKNAVIQANVIGEIIHIKGKNVTGLTIILPPYIKKNHFEVLVNDKFGFAFDDYTSKCIHIVKKGNEYVLAGSEPERPLTRKGRGIIDVYLDPVVICGTKTDKYVCEVADALSKPVSNGANPVIDVEYPIVDTSVPVDFAESNVIMIDNGEETEQLDAVRTLCKIKTYDWGYEYRGIKYKCQYCIMQILANHENSSYSILHIKSNEPALYRKNLFTRRMILPSYASGHHRYLNNEALIYADNRYYRIYEWGMEIETAVDGENTKTTNPDHSKFFEDGIFQYKGIPMVADRLADEIRYSFSDEMKFGSDWVLRRDYEKLTESNDHQLAYVKPDVVNPGQPYTFAVKIQAKYLNGISVGALENGMAYSYLFAEDDEHGRGLNFLNDGLTWASSPLVNGKPFDYIWEDNQWYWMKLEADNEDDELRGKIWKADEDEPAYWMHTASLVRMNHNRSHGIRYGQPSIRYLPDIQVAEVIVSAKGHPEATPKREPKIIQTRYETEDVVIADIKIDDIKIGNEKVDKTGSEDATAFIRAAISLCSSMGGGTIWLPEGKYRITESIVIKPYVTLRGDWNHPDRVSGENDHGTVIVADTDAHKNGDALPGLLRLSGNAGCIGLTVWYKNQNLTKPCKHPFTFEIPVRQYMENTSTMSAIKNCTLLNSYRGIGISCQNTVLRKMTTVSNVYGTALNTGLEISASCPDDVYENIYFDGQYTAKLDISVHKPARTNLFDATASPYNAESAKQIWNRETDFAGSGPGIPADSTRAIQNALDNAGKNGGGVVYLPAGIYRLDGNLTVPTGVEFRGCSPIPTDVNLRVKQGTVLVVHGKRIVPDAEKSDALITLAGDDTGLRGIGVIYKKESNGTYPYTVRGNGKNIYVIDLAVTNAHFGIDMRTYGCDDYYIHRVIGTGIQRLIDAHENNGKIEACVSKQSGEIPNGYYAERWLYDDDG
jgi:hypothetical protein